MLRFRPLLTGVAVVAACGALAACRVSRKPPSPLVAASTTMVTAWQIPKNPLDDPSLGKSVLADQIRWGYQIFTDTRRQAPRYAGAQVSCSNCHLNAGQRERSLPLVGVAGAFPEYNTRAARLYSLADRVVDCFLRSENATGVAGADDALPRPDSKEVLAVAAYISWISRGFSMGESPTWRGQNAIPGSSLIPVAKIDREAGRTIYQERCTSCHGADGQGVAIGDKKAGPLWGPGSWNDGAGASRVYTLAGIIRYTMPYLNPGSLTDEEAQEVAAFIALQPRPAYPFKNRDYSASKIPPDAVYYKEIRAARSE